jgi:molybdate transport system substrate-binding protein
MKPPPRRRLLYLSRMTVTIGFAIALAAPTASDAAEIKVLTTRAMNHVLTELAGEFQRTNEHKITLNLAPPAEIKRRIVNGEIVDVAMSGSGAIEDLVQQGKVVPDSKLILARVGTGVAVRAGAAKPDISSVEPSNARSWRPNQLSIPIQRSAERAAAISRGFSIVLVSPKRSKPSRS